MDVPGGAGKSPNTSLSFRYIANNEELEELYNIRDDDPPTPHCDASPSIHSENASPRRASSIIDKYFKSMKVDKTEKLEELKSELPKTSEEVKTVIAKDVTSSPVKDYLNRLSKRTTTSEASSVPEGPNETWKIFHDFKYKIAQAVEDMKSRSTEETKDKSIPRDNSTSDSEENSAIKDIDLSVGDTDNQVSSLDSSIQNLSEITQPITAKANDHDSSLPRARTNSESTDDTHKNLDPNDSLDIPKDQLEDNNMEVESGVEALEDVLDSGGNKPPVGLNEDISPANLTNTQPVVNYAIIPPPSEQQKLERQTCFMDFTMYLMTIVLLLSYTILPEWNVWNAFLLGMWVFYFCSNLKKWVLDNYFSEESSTGGYFRVKRRKPVAPTYTIPSVKEHKPLKKFDGWINHYRNPDYDPYTYHINKTTTAFMKLEGCNLRISYTQTKVAKRALWDEKIENVTFYQHRLYNLTGARVILLPKGLVRKRQWSKKYPICVILNESEKIQVLEKEVGSERRPSDSTASEKKGRDQTPTEVESTETNTSSPEKKKKFVWRKREKIVSHSEIDTGREGLRHRLVRKMHRDKKTESVATSTDAPTESQQTDAPAVADDSAFYDAEADPPGKSAGGREDDDDFDESELLRINEFLDEAESEAGVEPTGDGEWSVHVRASQGRHSHIYLFARTGRDKHEWYRRLNVSISEANSAESSQADERAASEAQAQVPDKDVNTAVYRVSEKEVSFPKPHKCLDSSTEQLSSPTVQLHPDMEAYEKSFWPYLFKIIQSKSPSGCQCRLLPPEVTWLNTVMARLLYDAMRDPRLVHAAQNRIQRKLNTLKLPFFMSPLIVTELSLAGACPLVESVSAPAWDERGVWLDADMRYDGGAYITILTQINLMKLKEKNVTLEDHMMANENTENEVKGNFSRNFFAEINLLQRKPAIFDSDCEDSAESSSDDESPPVQPVDSGEHIVPDMPTASVIDTNQGSSKKKFLRMVDKIAMNKYFQQVTDYKYVKRAMEGLSNTDIKLQLEVQGLEGRLALNLPPPPHDRLWIGFRTNPHLVLKARPAFGARTLRFAHISNWIEQKLSKEFEKFLVLPNMEDFTIDLMTATPVHFE